MNINDSFRFLNYGLPEDILRYKLAGDFASAIRLIDYRLKDSSLPAGMKGALEVQKIICRLLPGEFPYTIEEALEIVRKNIPDYTLAELWELIDSRYVRWIYVDGEVHIFNRFYSSICKSVPGFAQRAGVKMHGVESAASGTKEDSRLDVCMRKMKSSGSMTNRIRIRATLRLKDEFFTPGMFLRVHLPIPKACPQQENIQIERVFPENGIL